MEDNSPKQNKKAALVTGAAGMLGGYVCRALADAFDIDTLGRSDGSTVRCDIAEAVPDLKGKRYNLVVHCIGSENDKLASLNTMGTAHLLQALSPAPPECFVYVSSCSVYGEEGENVGEQSMLAPVSETAKSKEKAEREATRWAEENNVTLTIIRPARMFGTGVGGDTLRLFNDALNGCFIHIRGNDAKISLVTALDVAKVIVAVYKTGGTFNVADGRNPRFIDMVQSMTANAGREKRLTSLPSSWAGWLWRLCRWIPAIDRNLRPDVAERRMKTLTIDGGKAANAASLDYFDTVEVIARRDTFYPYDEK